MELSTSITLGTNLHSGQTRWDGSPYINHPLRVMQAIRRQLPELVVMIPEILHVAVLHDVIEDTGMTPEKLLELGYSQTVVTALIAISKVPGEDYAVYLERVKADPIARIVKIFDITDNLNDNPEKLSKAKKTKYEAARAHLKAL